MKTPYSSILFLKKSNVTGFHKGVINKLPHGKTRQSVSVSPDRQGKRFVTHADCSTLTSSLDYSENTNIQKWVTKST